jgi:2-phosphoglycerate kinase
MEQVQGRISRLIKEREASDELLSKPLLYICVKDDGTTAPPDSGFTNYDNLEFLSSLTYRDVEREGIPFHDRSLRRYARLHLKATLTLMGFKPLKAAALTEYIFERVKNPKFVKTVMQTKIEVGSNVMPGSPPNADNVLQGPSTGLITDKAHKRSASIQLSDTGTSVTLTKTQFFKVLRAALDTLAMNIIEDPLDSFSIAADVTFRQTSFTVLLGGTSGCGKSTLASFLASRISFTTVISTDNIRHMMRSFISPEEAPVLFASTYHAGEVMNLPPDLSYKQRILEGYEAQAKLVFEKLEGIISKCESRRESLLVEGVHLTPDLVAGLMQRHPTCIPFVIYINNDAKHKERFAIRAKYMTLDARVNKYIQYFKNIRVISKHLCRRANKYMIPKVNNTNVDRSMSILHSTIFNCIKKWSKGEPLFNKESNQATTVHREYKEVKHAFYRSKGVIESLKRSPSGTFRTEVGAESESEEEDDGGKDVDLDPTCYEDEWFDDGGSIGS